MAQLTKAQKHIVESVAAFTQGSKILVAVVEDSILNYYDKDSQSPQNLAFLLTQLHINGHSRYVKGLEKILAVYVHAEFSLNKKENTFSASNKKGIRKAQKEKARVAAGSYDWGSLTSLLNHDLLGGKPAKAEKTREQLEKIFLDTGSLLVEKGLTIGELSEMLANMAQAEIKEAA